MRILLINNEFPPIGGGGSILTSYIAKYLVKAGNEVVLLTSTYADLPKREVIDEYTVIRIHAFRQSKNFSTYPELVSFFFTSSFFGLKFMKEFKPDLIQAFFSVPAGATAMVLSRLYKVPYAVYLGGSDVPGANPGRHKKIYPIVTPVINTVLKHSAFVTACSDLLVDMVHKQLPNLDVKKIPNGVDTDYFTPPKTKPKLPPAVILGVGRIIPRKGFQFLIDAVGKMKPGLQQKVKIVIIGSGEYRKELQDNAMKLKIYDRIDFVDSVPYKELRKYYQNAHIFCLPSLAEGMPLAMIEAMACGCALLTTDVAGNQELVKQGKNGYLVKPGDVKDLQKKLELMLKDTNNIIEMGKESRELSKNYTWKEITEQYIKEYKKLNK